MKIVITALCIVLFFFVLVRYLEKTSVFYPSKIIEIAPDRFGLPYEDIMLDAEDGVKINGWLLLRPGAKSTILYFHGNAGNMSGRWMTIRLFYEMGVNIFIIDYRGYGRSQGEPSEQGVYKDGRAAFDYLKGRKDIAHLPIIIYGSSLGGAVAVDVAEHRPVDGLIIDSSFPSAASMARIIYPILPTWFMSIKFDSAKKIKDMKMPKLFFHSTEDNVVPFRLGQELFDVAEGPKDFVSLKGGHFESHEESNGLFRSAIETFLRNKGWL